MIMLLVCAIVIWFSMARRQHPTQDIVFWKCIALILLALAFYRFFNLEHIISDIARQEAKTEQLYNNRRMPQAILVSIMLLCGLTCQFIIIRLRISLVKRFALSVLLLLAALHMLRLISLHMVDSVLYASLLGVRINWVLEVLLLLALVIAALADPVLPQRRHYAQRYRY